MTGGLKFTEMESSSIVVSKSWGEENGELVLNGYRVSVGGDEKILEMAGKDGCTTMWM